MFGTLPHAIPIDEEPTLCPHVSLQEESSFETYPRTTEPSHTLSELSPSLTGKLRPDGSTYSNTDIIEIVQRHASTLSRFQDYFSNDIDPITASRVLMKLTSHNAYGKSEIHDRLWVSFATANPELRYLLDNVADCIDIGMRSLGTDYRSCATHLELPRHVFGMARAVDRLDLSNETQRRLLISTTNQIETAWKTAELALKDIDEAFKNYATMIQNGMEIKLSYLHSTISQMDGEYSETESQLQRLEVSDRPSPSYLTADSSTTLYSLPPRNRKVWWPHVRGRFGSPMAIIAFMGISFCGSLTTTYLAVTRPRRDIFIPLLDGGFYIALSQAILSVAAIYCLVLPGLRGDRLPIQLKWLFFTWLIISVIGAIVAPAIYPFDPRMSDITTFVSTATQLAATLQLVEGSNHLIRELELSIRRRRGRYIELV